MSKPPNESQEIVCPFCGEKDFDLVGLKYHFERGYCDVYEEIEELGT